MKSLNESILKFTKSFANFGETMKKFKEKAEKLSSLLIILNDKNFRKHNDAINMAKRLLRK